MCSAWREENEGKKGASTSCCSEFLILNRTHRYYTLIPDRSTDIASSLQQWKHQGWGKTLSTFPHLFLRFSTPSLSNYLSYFVFSFLHQIFSHIVITSSTTCFFIIILFFTISIKRYYQFKFFAVCFYGWRVYQPKVLRWKKINHAIKEEDFHLSPMLASLAFEL